MADTERQGDALVTYPVRELLDRMEQRLASIDAKLEDRATLKVVDGLGKDIRELAGRVGALEDAEAARTAQAVGVAAVFRRFGAVGGWVLALAVGVVSILNTLGVL